MNKFVECLKMIWRNFTIITVAVMIAAASYITVFYGGHAKVEVILLWQIVLVSFLCSLGQLFFGIEKKESSKKKFWICCFTSYIYVNGEVHTGREWSELMGLGTNRINTYIRDYGLDNTIEFIRRYIINPTLKPQHRPSYYSLYMNQEITKSEENLCIHFSHFQWTYWKLIHLQNLQKSGH